MDNLINTFGCKDLKDVQMIKRLGYLNALGLRNSQGAEKQIPVILYRPEEHYDSPSLLKDIITLYSKSGIKTNLGLSLKDIMGLSMHTLKTLATISEEISSNANAVLQEAIGNE